MSAAPQDVKLGSLGQAARSKQLNSARIILIIVGLLSLGVNGFFFSQIRTRIDKEVTQLKQQGYEVDQTAIEGTILENQIIFGAGAALGVTFIVLGVLVYQFPVPCTILGLVLYVGANIGFGLLNPATIASGIIVKVFVVFGLFKSVQSAFAYKAEMQAASNPTVGTGSNPFS